MISFMNLHREKSAQLVERAKQWIPGGVNSPVRAFHYVGIEPPLMIAQAQGAHVTDVDGNRYLDFIGAWGPHILGHADPDVVAAVHEAAGRGLGYGMSSPQEAELAQLLCETFPSMQMVRLVNSGTEATMSAIRLARGFTKRNVIVKFEGCYHGHADALLVKAGSGLATQAAANDKLHASGQSSSAPSSAGVTAEAALHTLVLPFNDLAALEATFKQYGQVVAAIILEPVVGNMGVVPPEPGYLEALRFFCTHYGALLIFDEVMTGARVALGGAQQRYQIRPDLTCLSKIIGGGLPVGAYGGHADIMRQVAPLGPVYQAGTLSGNPVTVAAGLATLRKLKSWRHPQSGEEAYAYLERLGQRLENNLATLLRERADSLCLQRVGSMFTLFFNRGPLRNWQEVSRGDHSASGPYARLCQALLAQGILLPPSSFEAAFLSLAHTPEDIDCLTQTISNN
jgi:glutamate-1-semialdehyde 2,1-aminomutase